MLLAVVFDVDESGDDVGALDHDAGAFRGRTLDQGVDPHRDRLGLPPEPQEQGIGRSHRRLADRLVGLERGGVQARHELRRQHGPHDLADRVGRHHPHDAEPGGQLGGDGRLADPGGSTDQDHERDVQLLDLPPPDEVGGVAVARQLTDHLQGLIGELDRRERCPSAFEQAELDLLRDLVRAERGETRHHHLGGQQTLREGQAGIPVADR